MPATAKEYSIDNFPDTATAIVIENRILAHQRSCKGSSFKTSLSILAIVLVLVGTYWGNYFLEKNKNEDKLDSFVSITTSTNATQSAEIAELRRNHEEVMTELKSIKDILQNKGK